MQRNPGTHPAQKEKETWALLYLLHRIIFHDCIGDYLFKGDPAMLARVPAHKSLFHVPGNKGLPIGNLTSQFFANSYLGHFRHADTRNLVRSLFGGWGWLNELFFFVGCQVLERFRYRGVFRSLRVGPDAGAAARPGAGRRP